MLLEDCLLIFCDTTDCWTTLLITLFRSAALLLLVGEAKVELYSSTCAVATVVLCAFGPDPIILGGCVTAVVTAVTGVIVVAVDDDDDDRVASP